MLRISRLTDYATVVMTCLATSQDEVLSAAQIAACTRVELPTVSKLLKQLARAGLVESFRGVNGGYRLTRQPADISVADIVEALEGPIAMTACSIGPGHCALEATCNVRTGWQRINHIIEQALRNASLADMLHPPNPVPVGDMPAAVRS